MTTSGRGRMMVRLFVTAVVLTMVAAPGWAQWKIESEDGKSSIKFGFLVQGWAESFEGADNGDAVNDLFFRRLRLLAGGKLSDKVSFFFETDSPGIGKGLPDGTKKTSDIYIQDFVVSYNASTKFILDGGLILIPTCYNCTQSAVTLSPVDYGAFSFLSSAPTKANVGRDYGLQARGYLADERLEYRLGLYQGVRGDGTNNFRYAGRVMWNFFDRHKGLYYTGNSLGKKKLFSIGASYDTQEEYSTYAFDVFFDHPVGESNGITLQADLIHYDGDTFLTALPETDAMLFEAAFYFGKTKIAPFFQYVERDPALEASPDQTAWQAGLAYYPMGYKLSLKLGLGEVKTEGTPSRFRGILQCQVFMF